MKVKINDKIVDAKLPKAFKKKWITKLRSGEFLQTEEKLFSKIANENKGGYCCLGVCQKMEHPEIKLKGGYIVSKKATKIPSILKGRYQKNELVDKLITMNDSGKWSFKRIASYVEKYL